jgi:geranylgeranyl diphosphate synthase type I
MQRHAPVSLRAIAERVDARLDEVLTAERERWAALDPALAHPVDEVRRLVLSGGKRLRPAFCHWGYVGAGDETRIAGAGGAGELRQRRPGSERSAAEEKAATGRLTFEHGSYLRSQ